MQIYSANEFAQATVLREIKQCVAKYRIDAAENINMIALGVWILYQASV